MKKKFFYTICTIFICIWIVSCGDTKKKNEPINMANLPQIPVTAYKIPEAKEISMELVYPGKTKSFAEINVVARVAGILKGQYFKEGDFVKKGAVLFLIERDTYQTQVEMAKAQLEKAQVELQRAKRDWKRISEAFKDKLVSEAERDKALSDLESAQAKVKEAQANLKLAELNLNYCEVKAEISGITGKRLIDVGNLVSPGTVLTTLTQISPLYVEFSIPERDLEVLNLKNRDYKKLKHQKIFLLLDEKSGQTLTGTIDFVDSKLDDTSSLKVRGIFQNKEGKILPNSFVRIKLLSFPKRALLVPQQAIMETPKGSVVFIPDKGKASLRPIKISFSYKNFYVVEEGLKPGDLVIIDNLVKLKPDTPIKIEKILEGEI